VSEMFIFRNSTLHSFGPEHSVPLVQIGKFQKGLIEETGISIYYIIANMKFLLGISRLRQRPHERMHQLNILLAFILFKIWSHFFKN
jgi:hypothetical protein